MKTKELVLFMLLLIIANYRLLTDYDQKIYNGGILISKG